MNNWVQKILIQSRNYVYCKLVANIISCVSLKQNRKLTRTQFSISTGQRSPTHIKLPANCKFESNQALARH